MSIARYLSNRSHQHCLQIGKKCQNIELSKQLIYSDCFKIDYRVASGVYGIRTKLKLVASLEGTCTVFQVELHVKKRYLRELANTGYNKS